jgi:adenylate cyclase
VLALVGDLRGAHEFADTLAPAQRVALLANVLGGLSEVVAHYGGTVDAVTGDSVVALFGLPIPRDDDAERAVGCAIALQLEVDEINRKNQRAGLPNVQIGVGVASGDVVIVGFGTGDQLRYKAVGEPLVLAPLVEASAAGGEVWICEDTRNALADLAHLDGKRAV